MIESFHEWLKTKKSRKPKAVKNRDIELLLKSIEALKKDMDELDSVEKKSKSVNSVRVKDQKPEELSDEKPDSKPEKTTTDDDSSDDHVDADRDRQSLRQLANSEVPAISPRTGRKSNRLPDSGIR